MNLELICVSRTHYSWEFNSSHCGNGCNRDLNISGVASELWNKRWTDNWKSKYAVQEWVENTTNNRSVLLKSNLDIIGMEKSFSKSPTRSFS